MTPRSLQCWLILLAGNMGLVGWSIGAREWPAAWAPIIAECVAVYVFWWWVEMSWPGRKERQRAEEARALLEEVLEMIYGHGSCLGDDCDCARCRSERWLEHHGV